MVWILGIWSAETARVKRISFTAFLLSHGVSCDPLVVHLLFFFTYTLYILSIVQTYLFEKIPANFPSTLYLQTILQQSPTNINLITYEST